MTYTVVNSLIDPAYPRGTLNYWKSNCLEISPTARSTS